MCQPILTKFQLFEVITLDHTPTHMLHAFYMFKFLVYLCTQTVPNNQNDNTRT